MAALGALLGVHWWRNRFNDDDAELPPPPPPPAPDTGGNKGGYRRRRRKRRRWFENKHDPRPVPTTSFFDWEQLAYILGRRSARSSPNGYACGSKSNAPTTVNVFYGSQSSSQHPPDTVNDDSQSKGFNPLESQDERGSDPNTVHQSATKLPFVSKPPTCRPMDAIKSRTGSQTKKPDAGQNEKKKKKKSPPALGGGANWSNVADRAASTTKRGNRKGKGGGASWSTVERRSKPATTSSSKSSRNGGGASW